MEMKDRGLDVGWIVYLDVALRVFVHYSSLRYLHSTLPNRVIFSSDPIISVSPLPLLHFSLVFISSQHVL